MAVTKRAKPGDAEQFIAGAPDAKPARWRRGTKTQITFTIAPALAWISHARAGEGDERGHHREF